MIIKSMSRKVPSFDQLIQYMDRGASSREGNIYYNLYQRKASAIYQEFINNSHYLPKRKNGVYMYHEVISITRSQKVSEQHQKDTLRNMVYQYIQDRARDNLVYAVLHDDKTDNLHYHLLISANTLESRKRHRLSRKQFDTVKRNLETYALERHPELEQAKLITKERIQHCTKQKHEDSSLSNKGAELKRRTGKTPQRDRVVKNLHRIFASATTPEELIELLESEHLKLYQRGKYWGVLDESTGRKHRFKTLGIANEFTQLEQQFAQAHYQKAASRKTGQQQTRPEIDTLQQAAKETQAYQEKQKVNAQKAKTAATPTQSQTSKAQQAANKQVNTDAAAEKDNTVEQAREARQAEAKILRDKKAQQAKKKQQQQQSKKTSQQQPNTRNKP